MVEFIEEGHIYLIDGVIVPSVSELIHFIFPDKYANVNKAILDKKADYGSIVHKSIECYEQKETMPKLDLNQEFSLKQYLKLKEKNKIEVKEQELMVNYKNFYAGRLDMIATVDDKFSLLDIKTTSTLDKEYLSWQLSFYELAYMSIYGTPQFEKLYAIWLPKKDYGQLIEIERKPLNELLRVIKEFNERELKNI